MDLSFHFPFDYPFSEFLATLFWVGLFCYIFVYFFSAWIKGKE